MITITKEPVVVTTVTLTLTEYQAQFLVKLGQYVGGDCREGRIVFERLREAMENADLMRDFPFEVSEERDKRAVYIWQKKESA